MDRETVHPVDGIKEKKVQDITIGDTLQACIPRWVAAVEDDKTPWHVLVTISGAAQFFMATVDLERGDREALSAVAFKALLQLKARLAEHGGRL